MVVLAILEPALVAGVFEAVLVVAAVGVAVGTTTGVSANKAFTGSGSATYEGGLLALYLGDSTMYGGVEIDDVKVGGGVVTRGRGRDGGGGGWLIAAVVAVVIVLLVFRACGGGDCTRGNCVRRVRRPDVSIPQRDKKNENEKFSVGKESKKKPKGCGK